MTLMVNNLIGFGAENSSAIALEYLGSANDSVDRTTYTFASQPLGTESSDRYIIVGIAVSAAALRTVSSVTIGGVSASEILGNGVATVGAHLWGAIVPTGTTGDVVVTFNTTSNRAGIGLWSIKNYQSTTPVDTLTSTSNPATGALDVQAGGAAIALSGHRTPAGRTMTWTNLSENFDQQIEGTIHLHSGASEAILATSTLTVTATPSGTTTADAFVAASYR